MSNSESPDPSGLEWAIEGICSLDEDMHEGGWLELARLASVDQAQLSPRDWDRVRTAFLGIQRDAVWRAAVTAFVLLPKPSEQVHRIGDPLLTDWLWYPFYRQSLVARVVDTQWGRRDEDAVIELARYFSHTEFSKTDFTQVPLDDARWSEVFADRYPEALCVVGRLGIFGPEAAELFGSDNVRFFFPDNQRPDSLPRGTLCRKYHRIAERVGAGQLKEYRADDDSTTGERTDYALVQRYPPKGLLNQLVLLAGCSTLGTIGAAMWATRWAKKITLPKNVEDAPFEALLRVTASQSSPKGRWRPTTVIIEKMYYGTHEWNTRNAQWVVRGPNQITIKYENGSPVALYFDGVMQDRQLAGKQGKLIVAILELAHAHGGQVTYDQIAAYPSTPSSWRGVLVNRFAEMMGSALTHDRLAKTMGIHAVIELDKTDTDPPRPTTE